MERERKEIEAKTAITDLMYIEYKLTKEANGRGVTKKSLQAQNKYIRRLLNLLLPDRKQSAIKDLALEIQAEMNK